MTETKRPDWDTYFMSMAQLAKTRSTCLRRQVGCVLVVDHRIVSTGYNGAPAGCPHCEETGCLREQIGVPSGERQEICRATHAEQNALADAARRGVPTDGAVCYVTCMPCVTCMKMLINAGITQVNYEGDYPDPFTMSFAAAANIKLVRQLVWKPIVPPEFVVIDLNQEVKPSGNQE